MQTVPAMAEMDQDWWAREVEGPMMLLAQRKAILRALLRRRFSSKASALNTPSKKTPSSSFTTRPGPRSKR